MHCDNTFPEQVLSSAFPNGRGPHYTTNISEDWYPVTEHSETLLKKLMGDIYFDEPELIEAVKHYRNDNMRAEFYWFCYGDTMVLVVSDDIPNVAFHNTDAKKPYWYMEIVDW